ncbi:Ser/Thr protein phosphatase [Pleurostoma richardsiae]|uniref:Ser/Thr protein phosphatase n=1 Tax=Pleurostoma richardsiae TaxID=41990 RepID=A0AA38VJE9_9PEZI|nr:Ser/Thr protein phosphatase [Pleurostoma richardsiae]
MLAALSVRRRRPFVLGSVALIILTVYLCYARMAAPSLPSTAQDFQPGPAKSNDDAGAGTAPASDSSINNRPLDLQIPGQKPLAPMSYGTTARPALKGMTNIVADLPPEFVPSGGASSSSSSKQARRLVIVGDVHGQKAPLQALLEKVGFSADKGDHLILTGDLVNKGPDSAGVISLAMELGAHAVRGNHDDRVLLADAAMKNRVAPGTSASGTEGGIMDKVLDKDSEDTKKKLDGSAKVKKDGKKKDAGDKSASPPPGPSDDGPEDTLEEDPFSHGDYADRSTARSLSAAQLAWLSSQPVILRVGPIPASSSSSGIANLVVVHGGLVPGVPLEHQDPWAVMNMRTLVYPVDQARRDAVRAHLEEAAKARAKSKGRPAPRITDKMVDDELARLRRAASGRGGAAAADDVERDSIALPVETHEGEAWTAAWNRWQRKRVADASARTTVVYGHDARRGLRVPGGGASSGAEGEYTFGLDSGCVYGRKLSALVIEVDDKEGGSGGGAARHSVVQVECPGVKGAEDGDGKKKGGK